MKRTRKPRTFIHQEMVFGEVPLSQIIEDAGCELVWGDDDRPLLEAIEAALPPLELVVLSLLGEPSAALTSVARFRKQDWLATIPILGVASLNRSDLDLWQLRALGIIGLVDSGAHAEHVRFRVGQVAYKGREGRRFERAPCCIPVEVEVDGERVSAYANSLSAGGLGLACSRAFDPNTVVTLRFSLDEVDQPITTSGRIMHVREVERGDAEYHVGVFFHELSESLHTAISISVARLLAAWEVVGDMSSISDASTRS